MRAKITHIDSEIQLPAEAAAAFDKVTKTLLGVNYKPIAYIGSQVVKGINYHIVCQARVIYPGAEPYGVKMVINDFQGEATLVSLTKIVE